MVSSQASCGEGKQTTSSPRSRLAIDIEIVNIATDLTVAIFGGPLISLKRTLRISDYAVSHLIQLFLMHIVETNGSTTPFESYNSQVLYFGVLLSAC
jgi:hypothetical protein